MGLPTSPQLKIFGKIVEGITVKHYLDEYLATAKVRKLSPSTIVGYQKIVNELSDFHKITVNTLTPAMIKNWIKQQRTTTKTIRNKLSVLRSAIDEAVTDGIIQLNPVSQISVDRYKSTTVQQNEEYEVDPFTPQEIALILDHCRFQQWRNLFCFALRTGLRSSELCALRWIDIDFIERTANIQKAKVVGIVKGTKTKSGNWIIKLDDIALKALQDQQDFTRNSDFVFCNPKTKKLWSSSDAIRKKAWAPTLKLADVHYRNPYQTHHTFATMHISQGANLFWLANQMGHKGPEMLFRHYGRYLKEYEGNTRK